jgi:hypothetical protein
MQALGPGFQHFSVSAFRQFSGSVSASQISAFCFPHLAVPQPSSTRRQLLPR